MTWHCITYLLLHAACNLQSTSGRRELPTGTPPTTVYLCTYGRAESGGMIGSYVFFCFFILALVLEYVWIVLEYKYDCKDPFFLRHMIGRHTVCTYINTRVYLAWFINTPLIYPRTYTSTWVEYENSMHCDQSHIPHQSRST